MNIEAEKRRGLTPILWGVVIGMLVGAGGLFLAAATSCGLCTHVTFSQMFFPYALIADPSLSHFAVDAIMAGAQWPLYGAIAGAALSSLPKRKTLLVIGMLVIVHAFGVAAANRRVNAWWEFKRISGDVGAVSGAI